MMKIVRFIPLLILISFLFISCKLLEPANVEKLIEVDISIAFSGAEHDLETRKLAYYECVVSNIGTNSVSDFVLVFWVSPDTIANNNDDIFMNYLVYPDTLNASDTLSFPYPIQ